MHWYAGALARLIAIYQRKPFLLAIYETRSAR
jgi:hypothetical protein